MLKQLVTDRPVVSAADETTVRLQIPATVIEMKETPRKTGQQIDHVIDHLNTRWDLQIPRLHGAVAEKAGDEPDMGRKCSSRIRALCWRSNVNMAGVIEDFEEVVQHKYSHWICKYCRKC